MVDLVRRIEQLSNENAVGALELVLQHQNPGVVNIYIKAKEEERRFRQVLAEPEARQELEARALPQPTPADRDDLIRRGDLARATLVYLAEQGGSLRDDVAHALDRPAPVGTRDAVTAAMIIGLVVLALRPTLDIRYHPQNGWTFHFKTEPLKDAAMSRVLGKLLAAMFPGSSGQ
jgi:hypothetical protein